MNGTYIVSRDDPGRVAPHELHLHAEPSKSVPLLRREPAPCYPEPDPERPN